MRVDLTDEQGILVLASRHQSTPELRLLAAVFAEVIEDLARGPGGHPLLRSRYEDARRWVESGERRWPYAFVPMCEVLGIDAARARARLLAIRPGVRVDIGLRGESGRPPQPGVRLDRGQRQRSSHRYGSSAVRS